MKLRIILLYGVLLLVSFLVLAMLWHWQMAGSYFVCQEHGIILDFLPPFAHTGVSGDVYLKPPHVVYTLWSVYLAAIIILPATCLWLGARLYKRDLEKAWR
jgi:hypothetical protein